ncbi:MAG: thiamine phosphate synthase [Candidatus Methylacidiphilales bacterium]|nr:thiamine phosphate synthase [Candidatus Methylacidiphilales bacterium]
MSSTEKKNALSRARLYAILDTGYSDPGNWAQLAGQLIRGGAGILQIRAKHAPEKDIVAWTAPVLAVTRSAGIPLILNDHPHLVPVTGADGCHIGQEDGTVAAARKLAGPDALVGKSTHSLDQARAAEQEAPDYIGFGPIFATATKPDYVPIGTEAIQAMAREITLPAFCIGGIKRENAAGLVAMGARRLVIVSGLLQAPDPEAYAREVLNDLQKL